MNTSVQELSAMHRHTVTIADTGESYFCADRETVLAAMERLGKKGVPVGCRGGGCGICKVQVQSGSVSRKVMSRDHVSEQDEESGCVLACRILPESDLTISVIGLMRKSVCR
jgi:ferredoxin